MNGIQSLINRIRPHKEQGRQWSQRLEDQPWFDQPNAMEIVDRKAGQGQITPEQATLLRKWVSDGYVVLDNLIPIHQVDEMQSDLDNLWTATQGIEGLVIEDIRLKPEDPPGMPHTKLVTLDSETRLRLKGSYPWRIHGMSLYSNSAREIFRNQKVADICSLIFDKPAIPQYTINFTYGSRQHLHQDTCVFHIHPANNLIGLWLACEDIHPDSGPLVYYPGSHKEPMYEAFGNYPQTNLKTCDKATKQAYEDWLDRTAEKYKRERFLAKKGQILLWHGMLIHGGDKVTDPNRTRKSFVTHYIVEGTDKQAEMVGPFNW